MAAVLLLLTGMASATTTTVDYGNLKLEGTWQATHWSDLWDLTQGDLVLSYTMDMTGVTTAANAWLELGLREEGAGDFNPGPFNTYQGGKGGWMTSHTGSLASDPGRQNINEKHNLSASGGRGEGDYDVLAADPDTVVSPFGTTDNYGIWFDRDGVDEWQATYWGSVDGGTYNTGGIYDIEITYHAIDSGLGSMVATVNGIETGFWTSGWKNAQPEEYPAGLSFKGDMTKMQVFAGVWSPVAWGSAAVTDLTATGTLAPGLPAFALVGVLSVVGRIARRSRRG